MTNSESPKGFFARTIDAFQKFEESPTGKKIIKAISILLTTTIAAYLVYKLTIIGWVKVWESLPTTPWFYVLFLGTLFCLPIFQVFVYHVAWKVNRWELFLALLNKRVMDKEVLGYSGDMYLYIWGRKRIGKPDREILHVLKDNAIISSVASTIVAISLLGIFFLFGRIILPREWANPSFLQVAVIFFCIILVFVLAVRFRKSLLFLDRTAILKIFGLHIARLLVVHGLQMLMWIVVMPDVPITNWMTLMAMYIIIERIPLLPSRDLIFMGAGIEMSEFIRISTSSMAGMLLASSVLNKIFNLIFFIIVYFVQRRRDQNAEKF